MPGRDSNTGTWLLLGGAAAALVYFMKQRAGKAAYMLGIRVRIGSVNMIKQKNVVQVELKIQNPNSVPVTVRSVVGDVFVNNERLGNVFREGTQLIAGNSESSLYVEVRPKALAIFNSMSALNMEKIVLLFRFVGSININNKSVPMNIVYRYQPLPTGTADNIVNLVKLITGKK
jgi:LEA14-like dessication related protein